MVSRVLGALRSQLGRELESVGDVDVGLLTTTLRVGWAPEPKAIRAWPVVPLLEPLQLLLHAQQLNAQFFDLLLLTIALRQKSARQRQQLFTIIG